MFSFTSPYGVMCVVNSGLRPRRSSGVRVSTHTGSAKASWISVDGPLRQLVGESEDLLVQLPQLGQLPVQGLEFLAPRRAELRELPPLLRLFLEQGQVAGLLCVDPLHVGVGKDVRLPPGLLQRVGVLLYIHHPAPGVVDEELQLADGVPNPLGHRAVPLIRQQTRRP